jgi:predicted solute-binding protein
LNPTETYLKRPRVCAVSYLNTQPLVWGLLKDPAQSQIFDLRFAVPSVCADQLVSGEADIGIVPVIEMARQKLAYFRETGIASYGPVRSILLISKVPYREIRKLATDSGSRTSVMLARIILAEQYGVEPQVISHPPNLAAMLSVADAALLIGDAALRVDPATLPFETLDLGEQWTGLTGLPMVFAVWAGRNEVIVEPYGSALAASCQYGLDRIEDIVRAESSRRDFPEPLVREYLTQYIRFQLSDPHFTAIETYLKHAEALDRTVVPGSVSA